MVEMVAALHRLAYSRQTLGAVLNEAIHAKRRRALQPWVLPIDLQHVPDCVLNQGRMVSMLGIGQRRQGLTGLI